MKIIKQLIGLLLLSMATSFSLGSCYASRVAGSEGKMDVETSKATGGVGADLTDEANSACGLGGQLCPGPTNLKQLDPVVFPVGTIPVTSSGMLPLKDAPLFDSRVDEFPRWEDQEELWAFPAGGNENVGETDKK